MLTRFENTCGVIRCEQSEDDKRAVRIIVTPEGEEILAEAYRLIEPVLAKLK